MNNETVRLCKSIILEDFGKFDKIKVLDWPLDSGNFGKNDVEIKVTYCGVNFADLYMRQGLIRNMKLPCVLGLECVGSVINIGSEVHSFKPDQRVLCYKGDGGLYRDTVIVNEKNCFHLPSNIDDQTAVTLPANYLTAHFCLVDIGNLRPGQNVLIHSCAGGVGWATTQLAKTCGNVTVVGTASVSKHQDVLLNGVDYVVNSKNYLKELTELSISFDIIIDNIGGSNIAISQSLLKPLGKLVIIGANYIIEGEEKISFTKLLKLWWETKNISVTSLIVDNCVIAGFHLSNLMEKNPEKIKEVMCNIIDLYLSQKIKPKIDSIYTAQQIIDAMKKLANRENIGKIIIKME